MTQYFMGFSLVLLGLGIIMAGVLMMHIAFGHSVLERSSDFLSAITFSFMGTSLLVMFIGIGLGIVKGLTSL